MAHSSGPLLVMMGSTGWRFLRYDIRAPAYVRRGSPLLALRVLGPELLSASLAKVGSGIRLVVADARYAQEVALNGAPFAIPNGIARERGKPELGHCSPILVAYLGAKCWELAGTAFTWTLIFKRPLR